MKRKALTLLTLLTVFVSLMFVIQRINLKTPKTNNTEVKKVSVSEKFNYNLRAIWPKGREKIQNLAQASLIIIGTVEKISGLKAGRTTDNDPMVYKDIAVTVTDIIKGELKQPIITVRVFGGKLNEEQQVWVESETSLKFNVGEKVLLALEPFYKRKWVQVNDGIQHFVVMGGEFGKFAIIGNEAVRGPYELPLLPIEEVRKEEEGLDQPFNEFLPVDESRFPLDKLISEIKANL
jgi:hypothetical protein